MDLDNRNKRIFISDIHLGDKRSWEGDGHPYPYVWIKKNLENLINFLDEVPKFGGVKEVVVLGDLCDEWIVPADSAPVIKLDEILNNPNNSEVIERLNALRQSEIALTYVPGNHDMPYSLNDLPIKKEIIKNIFPGINYVCDESTAPPRVLYRDGALAAEHGHMYCLCNAPDWSEDLTLPILHKSFLPLGYFVSRLVAYKETTTGQPQSDPSIIAGIIKESLEKTCGDLIDEMNPAQACTSLKSRESFARELLTGVASDARFDWNKPINIDGLEGYPPEVSLDSVAQNYSGLWKNWENHPPVRYTPNDDINTCIAAWNDFGKLSKASTGEYLQLKRQDTNIVIFGHTHDAEIKKYCILEGVPVPDIPLPGGGPYGFIYANCGAWVDSARFCSYVETEKDPNSNRHYVRLKKYTPNKIEIIDQGYVRLKIG